MPRDGRRGQAWKRRFQRDCMGRLESDFAEMYPVLECIGFIEITEESYRKGRISAVDKRDTHGGLVAEDIKPH